MISSIVIDGALKLVQIIRYGNKSNRPDVVRLFNPRNPIPEKVLVCNKYDPSKFIDDETGVEYKETKEGLIALP